MADTAGGGRALDESRSEGADTVTLICGIVGLDRGDHAFPMSMDKVNRVRLPSRFGPEDIQRIGTDFEILAGMFRDHPEEMARMLESYARKDAAASRKMAESLRISEETFTSQGGGIFWGVVAGLVVCDILTRCIDSFFE